MLLLPAARRGLGRDLLPAALAYAATLVSFVVATKLTTSAAAIFLQSTAPLWVTVLAPVLQSPGAACASACSSHGHCALDSRTLSNPSKRCVGASSPAQAR